MITYIRLKGFHRFSLVGNHDFELTITEPMVVILGTNGSGKSALLSQLTPIPPSPTQFDKLGYKETHHEFRNKRYVLKAQFSPSPRYFFSCDGVVLNDWGTQQLQKGLVEEHFGLNQKTFSLMQGSTLFSKMGPQERKDWIVALSSYDYEYAINLYNRSREKQRDLEGAIRVATRRLSLEVGRRIDQRELAQLAERARTLEVVLSELYETRPRTDDSSEELAQRLEAHTSRLGKQVKTFEQILSESKNIPHTEEQYLRWIEQIKVYRQHAQTSLKQNERELDALNKRIDTLEKCSDSSVDEVVKEIAEIDEQIEKASARVSPDLPIQAFDLDVFDRVSRKIETLVEDLPAPRDIPYGYTQHREKSNALAASERKLHAMEHAQSKILAMLEHMDEHKDNRDVTCPKCDHKHSSLYDQKTYAEQTQRFERSVNIVKDHKEQHEKLKAYVEDCGLYLKRLEQWVDIKDNAPEFYPWWSQLDDRGLLTSESFNKTHWLSDIRKEIEICDTIYQLRTKRSQRQQFLAQLKTVKVQAEQSGLGVLKTRRDHIIKQNERATAQLVIYQQRQELYRRSHQCLRELRQTRAELQAGAREEEALLESLVYSQVCEYYQAVTRQVQLDLANCTQAHHHALSQEQSIAALEKQIEAMREEESHYKLIIDELSPKNGLIAESLFGFIGQFFDDVNAIIDQVWTYPMRVLARDPDRVSEDVELDYRFPVEIIKSVRVLLKDVSYGDGASKGQKEMIDMAFLTTAMAHLQLTEFPLFLDEIGSSFDEEHKQGLIQLLKQILESRAFPQIFLVSHDFTQYTAVQAQTVVLDASNIRLKV